MPVPGQPYKVGKTHAAAFLRRLRELEDDEPGEARWLMIAVVRAKVHEHATSDDEKKRAGQYANGTSICRDSWWASNLEAGRAWLARGGPPKARPRTLKGGAYIPRGEYTEL